MDVERIGVTLTDQNFQTLVLGSERPVPVAFWAEGCGPWHLLVPDIASLREAFRGQAVVATLDVEAEPQTEACMPADPVSALQLHLFAGHLPPIRMPAHTMACWPLETMHSVWRMPPYRRLRRPQRVLRTRQLSLFDGFAQ